MSLNEDYTQSTVLRIGTDIVSVSEFESSLLTGGEAMLKRLFHPSEIAGSSHETLASIFAAKEAAFKALGLPVGDWHVLEVMFDAPNNPSISLSTDYESAHVQSIDLSIGFANGNILATVVASVCEI